MAPGPDRPVPVVSVVISTFNSRPYLAEALAALEAQTLPPEQVEVLVTDDGSTDGTGEFLHAYAAGHPNLQVFRQANSGGPSAGRNRGLAAARGRWVFFHDADDYLGPDALRRLAAAGDSEDADVVVGHVRRVGVPTSHRPTDRTALDADLLRDGVWRSLGPHKLFRRALLGRHGLQFPTDMVQGEDQVFVAGCLFAARKVTMLGGYDFYYRRTREDLGNLSASPQSLTNKLLTTTRMTRLVVDHTDPGERREALLRRVFLWTLDSGLAEVFPTAAPAEQEAFLAAVQGEVLPHLAPDHLRRAAPATRLRLLTARSGTADHVRELAATLARPWRYRLEAGLLTHDLGPRLNALLDAQSRSVAAPLPLPHGITGVRRQESGLELQVRLAAGELPIEDVQLVGRPAGGNWQTLGTDRPSREGTLSYALAPLSWEIGPPPADAVQRWDLRLRARTGNLVVAEAPLSWDLATSNLPAPRRTALVRERGWWEVKLYRGKNGEARLSVRSGEAAAELEPNDDRVRGQHR